LVARRCPITPRIAGIVVCLKVGISPANVGRNEQGYFIGIGIFHEDFMRIY